jgi:toxin CptA
LNRHNAPPVAYPLGRSPFLGRLLLGLWLAGLFSVLLWWNVTRQLDWRMALAGFSVLLAGLAARTSWDKLPSGQLAWDGEVWRWESAGYQTGAAEHDLSVIADFQQSLLLRLENPARASLWLWVEQSAMPERWLDLRRAVYSPHKSPAVLQQHDFLPDESSSLPSPAVAVSIAMHSQNVPQAKP